mmetsp:Transcript_9676/g.33379  ORF Transcript_9676/g.33379 Transcript_9676/m.33379 type:complete len:270 (+) Transcript_9676:1137-1946(+)
MVKVRGAYRLSYCVPLKLRRRDGQALLFHDVYHLGPHFPCFSQDLHVQKVPSAPVSPVLVVRPLIVDMQQGEVIAFWHKKLLPRSVALLLPVCRAEKDRRDAEHGDHSEDLARATQLVPHEEHLGERRVKRELYHLPSQLCEIPGVVKGAKNPQLEHGLEQVVLRRWVHEIKVQKVLYVQALQQQNHIAQVRPLYLGNIDLQHLALVGNLCEHPVTGAGPSTSCPTGALVHTRPAARENLQGVHSHFGVIDFHLHVPAIYHVQDAINGE